MIKLQTLSHKIQEFWSKIIQDYKKEPWLYTLLFFLVIAGSWLRLYNIEKTLMFQGDQGRDALIVARIFRQFDPVFIGPVTSVGNMYLGPFYYYFMLPFLWISYPSPIGPAIGVALANIITIILVYILGKKMFGQKPALWATFFMAFSQLGIFYSRFSWNPNLSPLFTLLTLFFVYQSLTKSPKNWIWVGLSAGLLIQLHYVNLIIIAVAGMCWLYQIFSHRLQKNWFKTQKFWARSFISLGIFLLTLVPLILFDWKHGWLNLRAGSSIFIAQESFSTTGESTFQTSLNFLTSLSEIQGRSGHLLSTLFVPNLDLYPWRVFFGFTVTCAFLFLTWRQRKSTSAIAYQILALTLVMSLIALSFYRHSVFDHYVIFFLPCTFLILGCLISTLKKFKIYPIIGVFIIIFFAYFNYYPGFYQQATPSIFDLNQVANVIAPHIPETEAYSLVLISENKDYYGSNYRYFLQAQRPNLLSPELNSQARHLFVVVEAGPTDIFATDIHEINTFGSQKVVEIFSEPNTGTVIYHLEK